MLINDAFFEDEVIDGFFVPGIMKRVWAQQIEILEDIDKVCRKNGICYSAAYGTMLGALRHGGFIPWDDDLDLWMERADYMKFIKYAHYDLQDNYEVKSVYSEKSGFDDMLVWVVNTDRVCFDEPFLKKYHGSPFRLGVDIFPIDKLPTREDEEAFLALSDLVTAAIYMTDADDATADDLEEALSLVEMYCGVQFIRDDTIRQQLIRLKDTVHAGFCSEESEECSDIMKWKKYKNFRMSKNLVQRIKDVKFCNTTIPVYVGAEKILEILYGDWKRMIQGGAQHDYPIISEQLMLMVKRYGITYGTYIPQAIEGTRTSKLNEMSKWLFIPFSDEYWENLDSLYRDVCGKEGKEVRVLPIPYYIKKLEKPEWHYTDHYEMVERYMDSEKSHEYFFKVQNADYKNVPKVEDCESFDIANYHADVIVMQCPYDAMGGSVTVHPDYYAERLRGLCKCLVYKPYFTLPDFSDDESCSVKNAMYYAVTPAVMLADIIVLDTYRMKEIYLNAAEKVLDGKEVELLKAKLFTHDEWVKKFSVCGLQ